MRSTNGVTTLRPGRSVRLYLPNTVVTATEPWVTWRRPVHNHSSSTTPATINKIGTIPSASTLDLLVPRREVDAMRGNRRCPGGPGDLAARTGDRLGTGAAANRRSARGSPD